MRKKCEKSFIKINLDPSESQPRIQSHFSVCFGHRHQFCGELPADFLQTSQRFILTVWLVFGPLITVEKWVYSLNLTVSDSVPTQGFIYKRIPYASEEKSRDITTPVIIFKFDLKITLPLVAINHPEKIAANSALEIHTVWSDFAMEIRRCGYLQLSNALVSCWSLVLEEVSRLYFP